MCQVPSSSSANLLPLASPSPWLRALAGYYQPEPAEPGTACLGAGSSLHVSETPHVPYILSIKHCDWVRKDLDKLLEAGVIEKAVPAGLPLLLLYQMETMLTTYV